MELYYIVNLNGKTSRGTAKRALQEKRGELVYSEYAAEAAEGIAVVICEQRSEALQTAKCWLEVRNGTPKTVRVGKASVGFCTAQLKGKLHYFSASWGKEFEPHDIPIPERFGIGTLEGRSSQEYSPWIGIESGEGCYTMALAWSGNWNYELCNRSGALEAAIGINEEGFFSDVDSKAVFLGAPVYLSFSSQSMEEASLFTRKYFIRYGSVVDAAKMDTLPVTYNTWWCYEDRFINEKVCVDNAAEAAKLGITNFVLDAGWFGMPDREINWFGKRGDWSVENKVDFPSGMARLGQAVTDAGIPFGIWCEIEGIGAIAELNRTHPEFVARRDGKSLGYLCMANPETRKWALKVVDRLVTEYKAKWIKFDFNVSPKLGCNDPSHSHGEGDGLYAHVKGYYSFLDQVRAKYPGVVLENCGSGGMRNDLGMLAHAHFAYMSDHDYVDNHFQCFWGATSFIPAALCYQFTQSECISDHNGIFNPITEDISPAKLDFYIRASLLSTCGFSYRFGNWKPERIERLKHYVEFFKYISKKYILQGDLYRLTGQALRGGKGDRWQAYQYLAADNTAYAFVFRLKGGEPERTIYLKGLREDVQYDITFDDCEHRITRTGRDFMENGIKFDNLPEEGSEIMKIKPGI
ncbi:MAG: alpha-galactosidase [Eubacteriales bacterium]|nr:alpha-galactosidase [Eubacteriales bacterium]